MRHLRLDGSVAPIVVPDRRRKVAFYEPTGIIEAPPAGLVGSTGRATTDSRTWEARG